MKKSKHTSEKSRATKQKVNKQEFLPAYTLYFLSSTKSNKVGDKRQISEAYIELGRDNSCIINVGEQYPTVSRKHASISLKDNQIVLKHMGKNPTLVNGQVIEDIWYLQKGDEFQLSKKGPIFKLYQTHDNEHRKTSSRTEKTGLTAKIQQLSQKAIRPYQYALFAALGLFLVFFITAIIYIFRTNVKDKTVLSYSGQPMEKSINVASKLPEEAVFLIILQKVTFQYPNGKTEEIDISERTISGTGFLCNDGKFVTARHVIQFWKGLKASSSSNQQLTYDLYTDINVKEQEGVNVSVEFVAIPPKGKEVIFSSDSAVYVTSIDRVSAPFNYRGRKAKVSFLNQKTDWLYIQTDKNSPLRYDKEYANALTKGEKLYILGYSLGFSKQEIERGIEPLYSESTVSQSGILRGMISISDRNFERGNSGGPVFVRKNNQFTVIGIVSSQESTSLGSVIPISSIK